MILKLTLLWALVATPAMAQKRVSVLNGKASLIVPSGFKPVPQATIARRFPHVETPQFAWSDKSGETMVALTMSNERLTPAQLPQLKGYMERLLPRVSPGLHWMKRETIHWKNRKWIHLEFVGRGIKKSLYNDLYFTSYQNRVLAFVFNTPTAQRIKAQPHLTRCRESIVLRA